MFTRLKVVLSGLLVVLIFGGLTLTQTGCRKSNNDEPTTPSKFTDLKVNPAFNFESFVDLSVTVTVANAGTQNLFVIQLFQENPATGGKLIATGSTDNNRQYRTTLRVPTRLKEVYIGKIAANGATE